MTKRFGSLAVALFAAISLFAAPAAHAQGTPAASPSPKATVKPSPKPVPTPKTPFDAMQWREVGPALPGGRVSSVVGSATNPKLYYLGSAGGGVWKSVDGGATWDPVFGKQDVASIGAIALDPTDDNTVYVGTGETNPRNDVSYGDGIYVSHNGGLKWTNLGLKATRNISKVIVDPKNPKVILVGALGDIFADSTHRGVYRSDDGGKTWTKTLYVSAASGVSDMAMDPNDPNIVYAGMWHFRREPWNFHSGGPDDGLYKSTDGGKTWTKLEGHGLPTGTTGKIAIAIAPSDSKRIYAIIESAHGLLFRSDDGGANWKMMSDDTLVDQRPFYFGKINVDPKNENKVYAVSMFVAMSVNGGKKFNIIAPQIHVDYHAMWIAPNDPQRIIVGEDGGYALTVDGTHWSFSRNLAIGQVYHVGVSQNENPYTICGGWQDNNAWCFPSNSLDPSGILSRHVISVNGGDGEWALPDPSNPNWIWSDSENGAVVVYNKVTQDSWYAQPWMGTALQGYDLRQSKYRFNWDSPIAFAPWNGHIAWVGSNVVFQSTDRGRSWKPISPDLTLNDKAHQIPSGGPITHDVSGAEYSDTILDIEGSHVRKGIIWVGTDDGLVQLTQNSGKTWANVTPPGVPPFGRVETVAPSPFDPATAYVSIDRHRSGDYKPYLFVTHNYGKTWTSIVANLPADVFVRTVRPDDRNRDMWFVGTETGLFATFDGGKSYYDLKQNLPAVSVRDIREQRAFNDVIIATHGRAVWVMDDISSLQQLGAAMNSGAMLFPIRTAYEYNMHSNDEGIYTRFSGTNPPNGVIITYYQKTQAAKGLEIDILDSKGHIVRHLVGSMSFFGHSVPLVSNKPGMNRITWDFGTDGPVKWKGAFKPEFAGPPEGPSVPPGTYSARVVLGGKTFTQKFVVKADPRTVITQKELQDSYNFAVRFAAYFSNVDVMLNSLDAAKKQFTAAMNDPKLKTNVALQAKLKAAMASHDAVFSNLTADFHNDEDSIERPGALREDMQGVFYLGGGLLTQPIRDFAGKLQTRYKAAVVQYNTFTTSANALSADLKSAGLKPITGVNAIKP